MLIEWKERGESYVTINAEWERITGKKVGKSTLSVRYPRIKASLACVASEDVAQMLTSKAKIDEVIQAEIKELHNKMWARVGKDMEEAGNQTYPVSFQHSISNESVQFEIHCAKFLAILFLKLPEILEARSRIASFCFISKGPKIRRPLLTLAGCNSRKALQEDDGLWWRCCYVGCRGG